MQAFPSLLIVVHRGVVTLFLFLSQCPLCLAVQIFQMPSQRQKSLFKFKLQLSDLSLNATFSKLAHLIRVTTESFNPQTPTLHLVCLKHLSQSNLIVCVYLGFFIFNLILSQKERSRSRNRDSHVYTVMWLLLSMLLKEIIFIYSVDKKSSE